MISTLEDTRSSKLPSSSENAMLMVKNALGGHLMRQRARDHQEQDKLADDRQHRRQGLDASLDAAYGDEVPASAARELHPPRVRAIPGARHLDLGDAGEQLIRERDGAVLGWQRPLRAPGDGEPKDADGNQARSGDAEGGQAEQRAEHEDQRRGRAAR